MKGKDKGEKGNGIYLGSMLKRREHARRNKRCLACYQEGKNFLALHEFSEILNIFLNYSVFKFQRT